MSDGTFAPEFIIYDETSIRVDEYADVTLYSQFDLFQPVGYKDGEFFIVGIKYTDHNIKYQLRDRFGIMWVKADKIYKLQDQQYIYIPDWLTELKNKWSL